MSYTHVRRGGWVTNAALTLGFLALTAALVSARTNPAVGYEVSVYRATPVAVWAGLGVAFVVSLVVSLFERSRLRWVGLALGGTAALTVFALPLIRGYYYYGANDAMTHLGWVRDLATGQSGPMSVFYPGLHSLSVFISYVTGYTIERAILLSLVCFVAVSFVFVPLCVRAVVSDHDMVVVASFAMFMLLPVNNVSTHVHAHPFTQAVLFSALSLFLILLYVRTPDARSSIGPVSHTGVLLALASLGVVLYHPMHALNVLVLLVGVVLIQAVYTRGWVTGTVAETVAGHRTMYAQTLFLGWAFVVWTVRRPAFQNTGEAVARKLGGYFGATPPEAGGRIASQGSSVQAIGGSLPELFAKLFLVSAVFAALTAVITVAAFTGRLERRQSDLSGVVQYFAVGTLGLFPFIAAYFAGNVAEMHFRLLGFLMLVGTILGAIGLVFGIRRLFAPRGLASPRARGVLTLVLAVMLVVSLVAVLPSPFIYKATPHITESHMTGYETAFETYDPDLPMAGVRIAPWRYSDGVEGVAASTRYETVVPDRGLTDLRASLNGTGYLTITDFDRGRELQAYRGLRYTNEGFDSLDAQVGVNKVESNGDFVMYHVAGEA